MVREPKGEKEVVKGKKRLTGALWNHVAYVLKDRSTRLEGARFVNPTFLDFAPVFDFLNLGGHHIGVVTTKNSQELFAKDSDKNFFERRKRVEILKEEIMSELLIAYPGRSAEEVKAKTMLLKEVFGTASWVALDDLSPDVLREGFQKIQARLVKTEKKEAANV